MNYFVTGATGFIGRHLVELLLKREGTIYVLVREGSKGRLEELQNRWGADTDRVVGVVGDPDSIGRGPATCIPGRPLHDRERLAITGYRDMLSCRAPSKMMVGGWAPWERGRSSRLISVHSLPASAARERVPVTTDDTSVSVPFTCRPGSGW